MAYIIEYNISMVQRYFDCKALENDRSLKSRKGYAMLFLFVSPFFPFFSNIHKCLLSIATIRPKGRADLQRSICKVS